MNRENELYLLFMNQKNLVQRFLSQSIDGIKLLTGFIKMYFASPTNSEQSIWSASKQNNFKIHLFLSRGKNKNHRWNKKSNFHREWEQTVAF